MVTTVDVQYFGESLFCHLGDVLESETSTLAPRTASCELKFESRRVDDWAQRTVQMMSVPHIYMESFGSSYPQQLIQ